ncbi:MAG TPA: hypothetical protein VEL07_04860 [Planctomycetota bacterium]|nr:hypothetical protein [Planctomycetota bacterium]
MVFPDTRWSLIGRLAEHPDQAAMVVDLYADSVARYLRLKFPREAIGSAFDDLCQEVLLWLLQHPDLLARARPGEGSKFRYLVMTLSANTARNFLRRGWTHARHEHLADDEKGAAAEALATVADCSSLPASATDEMDRAWAEALLAAAWSDVRAWAADGTLEPEVPRLLEAHLVQGRNLRDLAKDLGLPLATCHRRLARGRTFLQKAIVDRLRQAGELSAQGDETAACDLLLAVLRPG